ncbi:MAG: DUF4282 domain-containing protein [Caulobacteraceae bacterium]
MDRVEQSLARKTQAGPRQGDLLGPADLRAPADRPGGAHHLLVRPGRHPRSAASPWWARRVGLSIRGEGRRETGSPCPPWRRGILVVLGMALLWRAMCEFYIAVFRISDDLNALRRSQNLPPPQ